MAQVVEAHRQAERRARGLEHLLGEVAVTVRTRLARVVLTAQDEVVAALACQVHREPAQVRVQVADVAVARAGLRPAEGERTGQVHDGLLHPQRPQGGADVPLLQAGDHTSPQAGVGSQLDQQGPRLVERPDQPLNVLAARDCEPRLGRGCLVLPRDLVAGKL